MGRVADRTPKAALLLIALAVAISGCASDDSVEQSPFPPHERTDLAELFDPIVGPLGYRVTRAALIDRATYEVDPAGDHLAVYVVPTTDISADRFAMDLPRLVAAFVPSVFSRWSGLASFDVCQEPFGWTEGTPPSQTIVDLTRVAASETDWSDLDLATLIRYGREVEGLAVWARTGVRESSAWQSASSE